MITKEQAIKLGDWQQRHTLGEVHCNVVRKCAFEVGPKGGEKLHTIVVRPSGKCQTWKTRPDEFRLPVKYGLYEHGEITERNCADFHLASECPALKAQADHRGES